MGTEENAMEQRRFLTRAIDAAGIDRGELWLRYFSLGGSVGEYEIEAYVQGLISLPPLQRDILAHAANELIDELPSLPRAAYTDDPRFAGPGDDHSAGVETDGGPRPRSRGGDDTGQEPGPPG